MKNNKFNWGILGTATICNSIIPVIRELGSEVYAVASRSEKKAIKFCKKYNIKKYYTDYYSLIRDKEIQIIYIPLPNSLHYNWILKAIENNKHVLCEKPIVISKEEINNIIYKADKAKVIITEALMYRHHPITLKTKNLIDNNIIGSVKRIDGNFHYKIIKDPNNIRYDASLAGGSLWDLGYYIVSFTNFILGCAPHKVRGFIIKEKNGVDIEFQGKIMYPNNIFAEIKCSFNDNVNDSINFIGSKGKIALDSIYRRSEIKTITIDTKEKNEKIFFKHEVHRYLDEVRNFIDAISGNTKLVVSLQESRINVLTTSMLHLSAKKNETLELIV